MIKNVERFLLLSACSIYFIFSLFNHIKTRSSEITKLSERKQDNLGGMLRLLVPNAGLSALQCSCTHFTSLVSNCIHLSRIWKSRLNWDFNVATWSICLGSAQSTVRNTVKRENPRSVDGARKDSWRFTQRFLLEPPLNNCTFQRHYSSIYTLKTRMVL